MKILYIPVTKKIKEKNFKNYLICFIYDFYILIKNFFLYRKSTNSTSGYIDAAIHSNAYVLELPYNYCLIFSKILNFLFDGIFINWNGKTKGGKDLPSGTYFYNANVRFDVLDENDQIKEIKGWVQLLR